MMKAIIKQISGEVAWKALRIDNWSRNNACWKIRLVPLFKYIPV